MVTIKDNFNNQNEKLKDEDVVRLVNTKQVYFYIENGLQPVRVEAGYNDRIVFVFLREPTLELFAAWRKRDTGAK